MNLIEIDRDLEPIMPKFFSHLKNELQNLEVAIQKNDTHLIAEIGHKLKGSSGSYGFHRLQEIFDRLETTGKSKNIKDSDRLLKEVLHHINDISIKYVDVD